MSTKNTYRLTLYRYKLLSVSYIAVKIVPVRYIISLIDESETRQEHTIMNKLANTVSYTGIILKLYLKVIQRISYIKYFKIQK